MTHAAVRSNKAPIPVQLSATALACMYGTRTLRSRTSGYSLLCMLLARLASPNVAGGIGNASIQQSPQRNYKGVVTGMRPNVTMKVWFHSSVARSLLYRQRQTCDLRTCQPRLSAPIYAPLRLQLDSRVSSVDSWGFVTLRISGAARSSAQFYASLRSSTVLHAVSTPRVYLRALMFFTSETSRNAVESSTRGGLCLLPGNGSV